MQLTSRPRTGFKAAAAVAVAAVVASLAAPVGAGAATQSTAPASTSISIRVADQKIELGDSTHVRGNLNIRGPADEANREVTLEAKAHGETAFAPLETTTTGPHGGLRVEVAPTVTTKYRWHFAGAPDARPRRSGVAKVRVGPTHDPHRINTTLSIRAAHKLVDADGTATVLGRLRARRYGLPHKRITLLARTAATPHWFIAGHELTDRRGRVRFNESQTVKTAYRLVFKGTRFFQPARSGVVRVGVRPLVTIAAEPKWIDQGDATEISGVVTYEGLPLVGATVKLRARTARSHRGFDVVGTGITGPDGSVTIPDSPLRDTAYRLFVPRTADVPRGISPSVRVRVRFPTSLSIRGRHTPDGFAVSGALRGHGHAIKKAPVTLLALAPDGTTWTEVGTARTGRRGVVRFLVPDSEGTSYRLAYDGNRRYAPCLSGIVVD